MSKSFSRSFLFGQRNAPTLCGWGGFSKQRFISFFILADKDMAYSLGNIFRGVRDAVRWVIPLLLRSSTSFAVYCSAFFFC